MRHIAHEANPKAQPRRMYVRDALRRVRGVHDMTVRLQAGGAVSR